MKLLILPQIVAEEQSKFWTDKTSIISIVGPLEADAEFARNKNIDKIFRMYFNDLITDFKIDDEIMPAPVQSDFIGLKDFVDSLVCDTLVVHCGAGYSRSAAVAAAINEYLNLGYEIFSDKNFCPNITVYSCCLKEFGIAKTQDFYESLFTDDENEEKLDIYIDNER